MSNPPSITSLLIAILSVWRITHLFWGEDGPWDLFVRLRRLAGKGLWGSLLDCFYCLSLWIAAPMACLLGGSWLERGWLWTGLSGGAILLERATARRPALPPAALWHEQPSPEIETKKEEDNDHVMLR
jgi:hypothetical protein